MHRLDPESAMALELGSEDQKVLAPALAQMLVDPPVMASGPALEVGSPAAQEGAGVGLGAWEEEVGSGRFDLESALAVGSGVCGETGDGVGKRVGPGVAWSELALVW